MKQFDLFCVLLLLSCVSLLVSTFLIACLYRDALLMIMRGRVPQRAVVAMATRGSCHVCFCIKALLGRPVYLPYN